MLIALGFLGTNGCAAVGLTMLGVGAGVAAGTGTAYTLDGIAYRTFNASLDELGRATLTTLRQMDIRVKTDEPSPAGRALTAQAGDRTIEIELEHLTRRTTRMRVTAKHGMFWRDRATAGEIIAQTERSLDEQPAVSQKARREATP
jgi:hypothetical protein